ncbi:MAG: hypothetical protein P8J70_03350 [Glaciecola sp.]|jgi:hypothetical protein|nr:hypothetical protein [Glaciecola sp.]MDG1816103.1 hypothetical protein [Glaciecola sp.]MDG2098701.1 hypothetical protein [Glaciecola sp.]
MLPKRTSPRLAQAVETAEDIDEIVTDKRAGWRANPAKARRRQRRYKRMLTSELLVQAKQHVE